MLWLPKISSLRVKYNINCYEPKKVVHGGEQSFDY